MAAVYYRDMVQYRDCSTSWPRPYSMSQKEECYQPRPTSAPIPVSYHIYFIIIYVDFKSLKGVLHGLIPTWQPSPPLLHKAHMLYESIQDGFSSD